MPASCTTVTWHVTGSSSWHRPARSPASQRGFLFFMQNNGLLWLRCSSTRKSVMRGTQVTCEPISSQRGFTLLVRFDSPETVEGAKAMAIIAKLNMVQRVSIGDDPSFLEIKVARRYCEAGVAAACQAICQAIGCDCFVLYAPQGLLTGAPRQSVEFETTYGRVYERSEDKCWRAIVPSWYQLSVLPPL